MRYVLQILLLHFMFVSFWNFFIYSSHINPLWVNHIITLLSWCPVFLICCLGTSTALFYRWDQFVMYSIHVAMQYASPRKCHECLCPIFPKPIYSISAEFCSPDIAPFQWTKCTFAITVTISVLRTAIILERFCDFKNSATLNNFSQMVSANKFVSK